MVLSDLVTTAEALGRDNAQLLGRILEAARELGAREAALQTDTSRLQADRRKLEEDREQFQAECESVRQLGVQASDIIVLDVGGRHFHTTRSTLCAVPGSMLAAWFSGRHKIQTRPDGTVFIDRSPLLFDYVLDYLRTGGDHPLLPPDENAKERLHDEFLYFGLPWFETVEPSLLDFFGGDIGSLTLKHEFNPESTKVFVGTDRLLTAADKEDMENSAILWDTTTGQKIRRWPKVDPLHGEVKAMQLYGQSNTKEVILGLHSKNDGACVTAVVYGCHDGSAILTQILQEEYGPATCVIANGDTLVSLLGDKNLSARSIETGAVLWERVTDELVDGSLCVNNSPEAFMYTDNDVFVVCDLAYGTELYRAGNSEHSLSSWLNGKQLCKISQMDEEVENGVMYESWDEKGVVLVSPTRLPCEGSLLSVYKIKKRSRVTVCF